MCAILTKSKWILGIKYVPNDRPQGGMATVLFLTSLWLPNMSLWYANAMPVPQWIPYVKFHLHQLPEQYFSQGTNLLNSNGRLTSSIYTGSSTNFVLMGPLGPFMTPLHSASNPYIYLPVNIQTGTQMAEIASNS